MGYSWDAENRLINAASSLGKNIEYTYYEDGMLGKKKTISSSDTVYYIYDGIHCIAEYDGSNGFIKEIIYGPQIDEVLCTIDEYSTARYYHQDALQSVVAITDGFRNKIASYEYDVYGEIRERTGSYDNEILYTGRWLDSETGLYYYRARWYDADVGRFVSRDPIGVEGGINLYGYVGNKPTNYTDPKGLKMNWACFFSCSAQCVIRFQRAVVSWGTSWIEGLPPPDGQDLKDLFEMGRCIKKCRELCKEKDECNDNKKNDNDFLGTPNVPAVIPHLPPMVI